MNRCIFCKYWDAPYCKYHLIEDVPVVDGYLDMHRLDCGLFEIEYITPEQYHARTGNNYPDGGVVKYFVSYDNWETSYSYVHTYKNAKRFLGENRQMSPFFCVSSHQVPPDDWRPEDDK